ncbi:hypothetical protein PAXRUDRAFT_10269 [Paxillus rubicundulus Ve08.2h10]|uniref:DUF7587 domain-containing protein n=1 Tax=Paxillus rubicundulus Ve08.2h10 TaxID=930991 RepID=A0A0D0E6X6_9AGAM|nr:hypothetical protein PAXRUDRAFT_10269 [Paxillus rubicundulus Ve08.2h10]
MTAPPQDSVHSPQGLQSPINGSPLSQYGFGSEYSFDSLIQDNPFLFRIYTPKIGSQIFNRTQPYFVGQKFNEHFTRAAEQLGDYSFASGESITSATTYQDVAQHMDWTQRHMSPFISTTFSFAWAIWEATRRYRVGLKHDIEVAIIDARMLVGRAATALELLRKGTPRERHLDYWKWYRYALESQDVLVHGSIPARAVLASVPLLSLIDKLPSYFLRQDCDAKSLSSPFDALSWDTMDRKPSFRQFCQDMSDQFLRLPAEHRLRDATGGSVRLAMAFLRPWFHTVVEEDFFAANRQACALALLIAQWPAQWWSRDHLEMWTVIRSLVQAVAEEVREKQKGEVHREVPRLQGVVTNLERVVQDYEEAAVTSHGVLTKDKDGDDSEEETIVLPLSSPASVVEYLYPVPVIVPASAVSAATASVTQDVGPVVPPAESSDSSRPTTIILSPTVIIHQQQHQHKEQCSQAAAQQVKAPSPEIEKPQRRRPHSLVETASCIITGVLVGAFITLCIINSQRRTLVYVT